MLITNLQYISWKSGEKGGLDEHSFIIREK